MKIIDSYPAELLLHNETIVCEDCHHMYKMLGGILRECAAASVNGGGLHSLHASAYVCATSTPKILPLDPVFDVFITFQLSDGWAFYEKSDSFGIQYPGWNINIGWNDFNSMCQASGLYDSAVMDVILVTRKGYNIMKHLFVSNKDI